MKTFTGQSRLDEGSVVKTDWGVYVVVSYEEAPGVWTHRMRLATDEEELVSDVMQS